MILIIQLKKKITTKNVFIAFCKINTPKKYINIAMENKRVSVSIKLRDEDRLLEQQQTVSSLKKTTAASRKTKKIFFFKIKKCKSTIARLVFLIFFIPFITLNFYFLLNLFLTI
jgi:hypothetical protein